MKPVIDLMLDSGAFTAFTKGRPIDLPSLITFLKQNQQYIYQAIALDVISKGDPEAAARESLANYWTMRNAGIDVMPVYHFGESRKWLDSMLDTGADYIGLGTGPTNSTKEAQEWYQQTWTHLVDSDGYPFVKLHAFGDASPRTFVDYPWFSLDSTTWIMQAGRGAVAHFGHQQYQMHNRIVRNDQFIDKTDQGHKRETWERMLRARGMDPEKTINAKLKATALRMLRIYLNAVYILEMEKETEDNKRFISHSSLFDVPPITRKGFEREGPAKFFFALGSNDLDWHAPIIYALGIKNLLVSYYYIGPNDWEVWQEFLHDPKGVCYSRPRFREHLDILNEFLLEPK